MQDLFIELFPAITEHLVGLTAYSVIFHHAGDKHAGDQLTTFLHQLFPGTWVWAEDVIITDEPVASIQMDIALEQLLQTLPDVYDNLQSIDEIIQWQPEPRHIARFIIQTQIKPLEESLRDALNAMSVTITHGRIEYVYQLKHWNVYGQTAFSLTIQPYLVYEKALDLYAQSVETTKDIIGLMVLNKNNGRVGEVKAIRHDQNMVDVLTGSQLYQYPVHTLQIVIDPSNHDVLQQFDIDVQQARRALNLQPATRAQLVKVLSDKLKSANVMDNSYNTRNTSEYFQKAVFEPTIEFANNRTRDVDFDSLAYHFQQNGIYERLPRFESAPIKIAIINTLDEPIGDFVEALRRALERNFDLQIDMLRERQVRVISNKNLESAVRVVEKEEPHIVIVFLPDTERDNLETLDPNFQQLKSIALGKGIASHAVYRKTVHDPEAMTQVIMAIVGKTGNHPYVLAEPLDYADMVVGMDMVRQELSQFDRVVAMARIYDPMGRGRGYIMETVELDKGDSVPFIVMQTLFPEDHFGGKRVIIHRYGDFTIEELTMLARWEKVINAIFFPVAINTEVIPHIYRLQQKSIQQPEWGTTFRLNDLESLVVTSYGSDQTLPMPLHVKAPFDLGIERALHSVLLWTILNYGTTRPSRLPITVQYAQEMQQWMSRGQLPSATSGDVPFWL